MRLPTTHPGTCRIYNICVPVHTVSTVTIGIWLKANCVRKTCVLTCMYIRAALLASRGTIHTTF